MSIISPHTKTAVVLFNLGGPDCPDAVRPFLFNLFNDPAITGLPGLLRRPLASFISRRRQEEAKKMYEELGGKSPLIENTEAQVTALQAVLARHGQTKVFFAMRYWHPFAHEVVERVKAYGPDAIILLPLYPQFSTTTTGSFLKEWRHAAAAGRLCVPTHTICCYPTEEHFIAAHAQLLATYYAEARTHGTPRILFSAHGLPERIIGKGDPYQMQVEAATRAIVQALGIAGLDYVNCYQSKVGPLKWIGPATDSEILRAANDGVPLVVVPIAFVSEHSETLVELDIQYAELAHEHGLDRYYRVPTLSLSAHFIESLAGLCLARKEPPALSSHTGRRFCEKRFRQCPCAA